MPKVRHHAEQNNRHGKHSDRSSLQKIGSHALHRFHSSERWCVDKNRFQHEKVIIQRDETANEAKRDEPKKRMICASV